MSEIKTVWAAEPDQDMHAAAEEARKTFKYFWRELSWEARRIIPGLNLAAVKVAFATDDKSEGTPSVEHMWIGDVQFDGETVSGSLLNTPRWTSGIKEGDLVRVPLAEIGDWMYALMNDVYGGFSVDVMRRNMSAAERKQHDGAWGLEFPTPGMVRVVPPPKAKKEGMLSKLFGKKTAEAEPASEEIGEHPMSENMAEKIEEALQKQPEAFMKVDAEGWTLLQRDALAGNYAPVALMLKHGADAQARNPQGMTALDLARKMGWPRIVALLGG
jgi:uncharacterized protein YegJ (DUF2314 family)